MHGREEWVLVSMVLNINTQKESFGPCFQTIFNFLVTIVISTFSQPYCNSYSQLNIEASIEKRKKIVKSVTQKGKLDK